LQQKKSAHPRDLKGQMYEIKKLRRLVARKEKAHGLLKAPPAKPSVR
jgi:hypothetical protein